MLHRVPHLTCERAWSGLVLFYLFRYSRHFGFQKAQKYLELPIAVLFSRHSTINMEIYPHLVSSQSLRRSKQSLRRAKQSLRKSKQSLRRTKQSLRRANKQSLRRANKQSLRRANKQSLRRSKQSLRRSKQSLRRPNQSLRRSEQANTYNIVHLYSSYIKCINSGHCACACSCRSTLRRLTKQANVKRSRDRAPSRLPLKRIILAMRKRKNRLFLKHYFVRNVPKSSILNKIASNFKQCCFQFVQIQHIFINSFGYFKPCVNINMKNTAKQSLCNMFNSQNIAGNIANEQYHISQRALMLSGDIELNPGPVQNNSPTRLSSNVVLQQRLRCFQLRPFDVGGDGDCFFRAVSHHLYADPERHFEVRMAGIAYMRDNPERFIESNTEISWLEYLNNMSMQGTWGDAMIIQAVADQLKLKITIAETHEGFREYRIIQPVSSTQQLTHVYLGHIDEYHYVSTLPCTSMSGFVEIYPEQSTQSSRPKQTRTQYINKYMRQKRANETQSPEAKEKRRVHAKEYRKRKQASQSSQPLTLSIEAKQKKRLYAKEYRKQKQASESSQPSTLSIEAKQKKRLYEKEYRKQKQVSESSQPSTLIIEAKQKKRLYAKEYMKRKRASESSQPSTLSNEAKQKKRLYAKEYRKRKQVSKSCQPSTLRIQAKKKKRLMHAKEYRKQKRCEIEPLQSLISQFHDVVSQGPLYICTCCDQLWYKHSVIPVTTLKENIPDVQKRLLNRKSVNNVEWLCKTCNKHLKNNKVPPCAAINGLQFPEKPSFFDLNELECRLLAPRLAFQKLMQAPRGRQLKINGNIVNVPADVVNTVNMLPRFPNDTSTIKVNLKRRLQYKSSALSLNVRPNKVAEAAKWLVNNGNLYKDEGITFNDTWLEDNSNTQMLFDDSDNDQTSEGSENVVDCNAESLNCDTECKTQQSSACDDDEHWSEDEAEIPAGITDTMLTSPDFVTNNERQHILNVAPGEGNRPMSIFRDKYSEELAYPGIFLGQKRPDNTNSLTKVHYSEICKSELRRSERRAAMCVENIFFKTKKLQMKILLGQSQVALRKCQRNSSTITAGQLKQPGALDNMIDHDQGFKFLRAVRGSPPYFEKAKKDIFAMIRQLGSASLFCSFSSAKHNGLIYWEYLVNLLITKHTLTLNLRTSIGKRKVG